MESFSLFKNKFKKSEKQPDYVVSTKVGDSYEDWGACWIKKTAKGDTFLSGMKSKPKAQTGSSEEITPDDIPF